MVDGWSRERGGGGDLVRDPRGASVATAKGLAAAAAHGGSVQFATRSQLQGEAEWNATHLSAHRQRSAALSAGRRLVMYYDSTDVEVW